MEQLGLGDALVLRSAPLAERMRPRTLEEVVGQVEVAGNSSPIRKTLAAGQLQSLILWGPPGTGKTTIAMAIAREADAQFVQLNAVMDGIKELREIINQAKEQRRLGRRTLLFIDEIARWNKAQQDALLPHVEAGTITLIGATTENPGFEINDALLSRLTVYVLKPLSDEEILEICHRALGDAERGLGFPAGDPRPPYTLSEQARKLLLLHAGGDARSALNALEIAAALQPEGGEIGAEAMEQALQRRRLAYGKGSDHHYDTISALIKSIRGSDPDAGLYYLARLEAGGEDPRFVARRLVISASEDVGMGTPGALAVAVAGFEAVEQVGPPECWINLAHVVCYLATCKKNWASYRGLQAARELVAQHPSYPIPEHLRNPSNRITRRLGHGLGYAHPADGQQDPNLGFLPPELRGVRLYEPERWQPKTGG